MSEHRPWATKSAAQAFGFVPCPNCNPEGKPSGEIFIMCAVCWKLEENTHRRFILRSEAERWAKERGMGEDDIDTSPETRGALASPPALPTAPTEPAPPPYKPIKREEDE